MNDMANVVVGALCAWRENRGGGRTGMQSVLNVLVNRAKLRSSSIYEEAVRREQFSSMTSPGDPQLSTWPERGDVEFATAMALASAAADGDLEDITGGATNYYATTMSPPPYWEPSMTFTVEIKGQRFYR